MAVSQLVRRSVEAVSILKDGQPYEGDVPQLPVEVGSPWLVALLFFTVLAAIYASFSVQYTYGLLVPTLAAVEDSNPELYLRVDTASDNNKQPGDPADLEMEVATAPPKPITSKLRTTIRHLRSRAGPWSRFRGLSMFLTYIVAQDICVSFVPLSAETIFGRLIVKVASAILLANLHVAWVHIVISEPSPKRFYKRIPSFRTFKKILPAAAFEHLLTEGAYFGTLFIIKQVHGLGELNSILLRDSTQLPSSYRSAGGILAIAGLVRWLASIPANVIFIRVAASLLPTEDEAIVPFDRGFGGKVPPSVVGGGVLSISDAWKTFDWDARKRYVKAVLKAVALEIAVIVFFSLVIFAEIFAGALVVKDQDKA